MQLVLCDVCRKNTNREVPLGTVTRSYKKDFKTGSRVVASQEFVTEILPMTTTTENQERLHVCLPCFSAGMTEAAKPLLPEKTPEAPTEFMPRTRAAVEEARKISESGS